MPSDRNEATVAMNASSWPPRKRPDGSAAVLVQVYPPGPTLGRRVTLTSTFTAHAFYLSAGYADFRHEAWEGRDWPLMEKMLS